MFIFFDRPICMYVNSLSLQWVLHLIPYLLYALLLVGFLYGGAGAVLLLEERFSPSNRTDAHFVRVLLMTFDGGARLGWGQWSPAGTPAKAFMAVYTLLAVGLVNGFIATVGSLITDVYCVHWPCLVARIRGRVSGKYTKLELYSFFTCCEVSNGLKVYKIRNLVFIDCLLVAKCQTA